MLLRGMVRMDMARRLNAYRVLSLALCSLALVGWGAFADLRAELAQSKAAQDQLRAEREQQQAAVGDLAQIQANLAFARGELETLAQKREQAASQVVAAQQELVVLTKRRDEKQANASEKGSVRRAKLSSKPAQVAAQGKGEKASETSGAQGAKPPSKPARLATRTKHDA
jgi:chromosome segregation ATPase